MRMIYLMMTSLVISSSLAQAEQSAGKGYSERDACNHANTNVILDMEMPSDEILCKRAENPDCGADYIDFDQYYTVEKCVCSDGTPQIPDVRAYSRKENRDPNRWTCNINYYKIPGKW